MTNIHTHIYFTTEAEVYTHFNFKDKGAKEKQISGGFSTIHFAFPSCTLPAAPLLRFSRYFLAWRESAPLAIRSGYGHDVPQYQIYNNNNLGNKGGRLPACVRVTRCLPRATIAGYHRASSSQLPVVLLAVESKTAGAPRGHLTAAAAAG